MQVAVDGWQVVSGVPVECGFVGPDLNGLTNFSVPVVVFPQNDLDVIHLDLMFVLRGMFTDCCQRGLGSSMFFNLVPRALVVSPTYVSVQ